jgi:DNA-binding transcriptional regulator GbsR (MarR family)
MGRVVGQLYIYLYFSSEPRNLADMQAALGCSKGSASTAVRQLEAWGAVKKVWVKGDRKDYYEASDWFGKILKNALLDTVGKKMASYSGLLEDVDEELSRIDPASSNGDGEFIRDRINELRKFQKKTTALWSNPLLKMLLK